jgi:hypothetical protein
MYQRRRQYRSEAGKGERQLGTAHKPPVRVGLWRVTHIKNKYLFIFSNEFINPTSSYCNLIIIGVLLNFDVHLLHTHLHTSVGASQSSTLGQPDTWFRVSLVSGTPYYAGVRILASSTAHKIPHIL